MIDYQSVIDKYYESGSSLREILIHHSRQVALKALAIAKDKRLEIDPETIEAAAMLHDIGIIFCNATGIKCYGTEPYIKHGILGAKLLRDEGLPEWIARIAERHTGAGLTAQEIERQHLPLPSQDYLPETLLEKLICYADKFFSKSGDMKEKSLDRVRASMKKWGENTEKRFERLHEMFG